jgi:hypothetical protein
MQLYQGQEPGFRVQFKLIARKKLTINPPFFPLLTSEFNLYTRMSQETSRDVRLVVF